MLLALFFLLGCGGCAKESPRPERHYAQAEALFAAVSMGDLELARELAREMEGKGLDLPPAGTQEHLDRVHGGIGLLFVAEDRAEAAAGVAGIAQGCGGCHAQLGVAKGPVGEGLQGAWTGLWRGSFSESLEASTACSELRGVSLGDERSDTASELDAAGAFAELLALGGGCAPKGHALH